jgi:hypothetical protein
MDACNVLLEAADELERLQALCQDLVGEEALRQDGQYETEMRRLRTKAEKLDNARMAAMDCLRHGDDARYWQGKALEILTAVEAADAAQEDNPPAAKCPEENSQEEAKQLRTEVERLQKLEGNDDRPENRCERCGGRNLHNWYADSDVWNRVAGEYSILCPICFSDLAREAGVMTTAWRLSIEGDDPEVSKLRTALHARLEESAQLWTCVAAIEDERLRIKQLYEDYQPGLPERRLGGALLDALDAYKRAADATAAEKTPK